VSSGQPELGVVCRNCGAEVSAYVTECPYCGQRLRKRAPKLRRVDGEVDLEASVERRRLPRMKRVRARIPTVDIGDGRPWAILAALAGAAILVVVQRGAGLNPIEVGAVVGASPDWWHYLAAPFVYDDLGYFFATGLGVLIFGIGVERRIGTVATAILILATGSLGMLAAAAASDAVVAVGQNGVALGLVGAWAAFARREEHAYEEDAPDWIPVAIAALVLLVLPVVEDAADPIAGVVGGLVGFAAGELASRSRAKS